MMMMKSVIWWRKPEYPEETTDLRQVTDETFHTYGLCPVRGLNLGRSGGKQSELRRDERDALAHRATAVPHTHSDMSLFWPTIEPTRIFGRHKKDWAVGVQLKTSRENPEKKKMCRLTQRITAPSFQRIKRKL